MLSKSKLKSEDNIWVCVNQYDILCDCDLWMLLIETQGLKFDGLKFKWVTLLWDHIQPYIFEYDFVELNIL